MSNSGGEFLLMITELDTESRRVGLKIKIKVMRNSLGREQRFAIGGETLEVVKEYVYLGQVVTAEPDHESEITRRIRMGWSTFGKHSHITNGSLPLSLKRKVHNSCILPVLTYEADNWRLT
uniref:Rvt 1 n=1 Tax=Rhipicephalus zambeziensis TaxID=60191 RepID=A0A224YYP9_9ACAR